jgi:hypothetical protein
VSGPDGVRVRADGGSAPPLRLFRSRALTEREREQVRRVSGRKRFAQKRCFYNAQRLVLDDPTLRYGEGQLWLMLGSYLTPVHHAWVVVNGKVVDPTRGVMGLIPSLTLYRGKTFGVARVRENVSRTLECGPLLRWSDVHNGAWVPSSEDLGGVRIVKEAAARRAGSRRKAEPHPRRHT